MRGDRGRRRFRCVVGGRAQGERARPALHQPVRRVDDGAAGSVVLLQPHHRGVPVAAAEAEQILRGGAGERVDGLAGVADHAQVVAVAEPQVQQRLLQRRHVLVLVDDEEPVLLAHLLGDPRLALDHAGAGQQHVLEVELAARILRVLVGLMQVDDLLGAAASAAAIGWPRPRRTGSSVSRDTLRHSISAARSRRAAVSIFSRSASAASASTRPLLSRMRGIVPPITCGQK